MRCYYCKQHIDNTIDYCRCCHACLAIDLCPGCCGSMEVRCYRYECHLMDKKCIGLRYYKRGRDTIREYCYECSGGECEYYYECSNSDCEKCYELEDYNKICGSCNELMDECECDDIRRKSQVVHKNLHYAALRDELMRMAWHPNRYWDWCVPEDEKRELEAWFVK